MGDWLANLFGSGGAQAAATAPALPPQQIGQPAMPQAGGFGQTIGDIGRTLQNIGGFAVDALGIASSLNAGNLPQYLAAQRQMLQDPAVRGDIGPFTAGMLGQGLTRTPAGLVPPGVQGPQPPGAERFEGAQPNQLVADLPPLGPEAQYTTEKQRLYTQLYQQAEAGNPQALQALHMTGTRPGPYEFASYEEAQQAGAPIGAVPHPTNRGTWGIARPPVPPAGSWGWNPPTPAGGAPPAAPQAAPQPAPQPAPTAALPPPGVAAPPAPDAAGAGPDAEGYEDWNTFVQRQSTPEGEARVGYPSPAFVESKESVQSWEARNPTMAQTAPGQPIVPTAPPPAMRAPGLPAPQPQLFRAGPSAMPPGQMFLIPETPGPGEKITKKISPDITITKEPPKADKQAAPVAMRKEMMGQTNNLLSESVAVIDRLVQKGVLTDTIGGAAVGNVARLHWAATIGKDADAAWIAKNLPGMVPLLARAFGEASRPNVKEEERLREALSPMLNTATGLRNVLTNYQKALKTGHSTEFIREQFPTSAQNWDQTMQGVVPQLTPEQEKFLQGGR